jgi:hypothetical protein
LPKIYNDGWRVSISVASEDALLAKQSFQKYINVLERNNIVYALQDEA